MKVFSNLKFYFHLKIIAMIKKTFLSQKYNNFIILTSVLLLCFFKVSAQEDFSGINTSQRVGFLNTGINPAEFANLDTEYTVNIFAISVKASSNKVSFSDLFDGSAKLKTKLFEGEKPANLSFDGEIYGPSIAYKWKKWGFAISSKAHAKLDVIDVDDNLGNALTESVVNSFFIGSTTISNDKNQRLSGTSWGEVAFSAGGNLYEDSSNKFNAGASFKLLFPGSYANFGADKFNGTINNNAGEVNLTDTNANLNIAYSGNLGNNFTQFGDYARSLYGKLHGVAFDIGASYQLKDSDNAHYKLNVGVAIRDIGGMTFSANNNSSTNYKLTIPNGENLNLNQFQSTKSLKEVEAKLLASGFLDKNSNEHTDFKVKLPTIFSGYADVKIVPSFYVTVFTQQRVRKNDDNDQISSQNIISLTPRYTIKNYEIFLPFSHNEISGIAGGIGARAYGFYIGSGSIITALISQSNQADAYIGYDFKLN